MSQTQQTLEAARIRIQRLVEEIAALSKSDVRSEEYYQQFLEKSVQACDAKGGGIWLVGQRSAEGKSEYQLAAVVELDSSLFRTDEAQRSLLLSILGEVVRSKKPYVLSASEPSEEGSLQAQLQQLNEQGEMVVKPVNRTPYPFIHVPLFHKEQVLGVLQIWLQPYVTRENYTEFCTFLSQLATNIEQHFQTRRLGNLVVENQRLQHFLKFSSDLTGSLDALEVSRVVANYGRDLLGCERCSVFVLKNGSWKVLAISGQEVVESKSTMVKAMVAFISAHLPQKPASVAKEGGVFQLVPAIAVLNRDELLEVAPSSGDNADDAAASRALTVKENEVVNAAYYDVSQANSGLLCQALDADKNVVAAVFAESTAKGAFTPGEGPAGHRIMEWVASSTGRAIKSAYDYQELPFLAVTRRVRDAKRKLLGEERKRHAFKMIVVLTLILGTLLFPWMEEVESDCTLVPEVRLKVVPEVAGVIQKVFVREGTAVKKGDPIAQMDVRTLESELKATQEDKLRFDAEARRLRGNNDEAGAQIAATQLRVAEEKEKKLLRDVDAATIRSPIDGVVLTPKIEMYEGVYLQPGADFAAVTGSDEWDLHVFIHEKEIGKVERLLKKRLADSDPKNRVVPVDFILYTHNMHQLAGELKDPSQFSQIAYPHERENALRENAFILTLNDVQAPPEVRSGFRPDLTGRASIKLGRTPLVFLWGRSLWNWIQLKWVW